MLSLSVDSVKMAGGVETVGGVSGGGDMTVSGFGGDGGIKTFSGVTIAGSFGGDGGVDEDGGVETVGGVVIVGGLGGDGCVETVCGIGEAVASRLPVDLVELAASDCEWRRWRRATVGGDGGQCSVSGARW